MLLTYGLGSVQAVFSFTNIVFLINGQMMQGLATPIKESGWLPEWASPGHRDCMIGSKLTALIADSY